MAECPAANLLQGLTAYNDFPVLDTAESRESAFGLPGAHILYSILKILGNREAFPRRPMGEPPPCKTPLSTSDPQKTIKAPIRAGESGLPGMPP